LYMPAIGGHKLRTGGQPGTLPKFWVDTLGETEPLLWLANASLSKFGR